MTAPAGKPFAVGDLVRWTSAGGGVWRHHVGVIVAVVPPQARPYQHVPPGRWSFHYRTGAVRREVSFLVALKADGGRGAVGKLHRPRTSRLMHFDAESNPVIEVRARRAKGFQPGRDYALAVRDAVRTAMRASGERLANGARFTPASTGTDLVPWRPQPVPRWAVAVGAALFGVLVAGAFRAF